MQLGLRPYTWRFTEIAAVAKNMVGIEMFNRIALKTLPTQVTAANILGIPLIATEHKGSDFYILLYLSGLRVRNLYNLMVLSCYNEF